MTIRTIIGIVLLTGIGAGCVGTTVHFADVPLERLDLSQGRKVTGKAAGFHLFDLIPIGVNDRQARAYEKLQEEAPDQFITRIKIQDSWKFLIIGHRYGTIMTGIAYPDKTKQSPASAPVPASAPEPAQPSTTDQ